MQGSGVGLWRPGGGLRRRLPLAAVFAVLTAVMVACETSSTTPAPHVSALVPGSAVEGSDDLVVAIAGEHFQPGASVVLWNGSARPTQTFLGTTTLIAATIFRGDLLVPGPATVTVTIVESGVRRSSPPITFDVVPAARVAGRDSAACHEAAVFKSHRPEGSKCI